VRWWTRHFDLGQPIRGTVFEPQRQMARRAKFNGDSIINNLFAPAQAGYELKAEMAMRNTFADQSTRVAMNLLAVVLVGFLAFEGREILVPLVFAAIFSFALMPAVEFMENKWRFPRGLASSIAVIVLVCVWSVVLYYVVVQLNGFTSQWPDLKERLIGFASDSQDWLSTNLHLSAEKQKDLVKNLFSGDSPGKSILSRGLLMIPRVLIFLVLLVFFIFFILFYQKRIALFLLGMFSRSTDGALNDIALKIRAMIKRYIGGLLMEMTLVCGLSAIPFAIIGVPYAFLLGLMICIFNLVPYAGLYSATAISMLITLAITGDETKTLLIIAVMVPVHLIDSNIITPFLVGSSVRVNAFITFLAVVIAALLWGIPGMILSIPMTAVAKIVFDHVDSLKHWGVLFGAEKKDLGRKK